MSATASVENMAKNLTKNAEKCGTLAKDTEKEVTREASDLFGRAKTFFTEASEEIVPAVENAIGSVKESVSGAIHSTTGTFKKYPVRTLAIGFGIGCAVGYFALRRAR